MLLADYAQNVYSQYGEDGILAEIIRRLGDKRLNRWCVEVGAWDGVFLSNTCDLIRTHGFSAVMIEGDPDRAALIRQNHPSPSVMIRSVMAGFEGPNRLDAILGTTPLPEHFAVLSIDVDGTDYWIFESMQRYRPQVIVIEYNPSIPNVVLFVQERDPAVSQGSSGRALLELAHAKGYQLAAATTTNLILVADEVADAVLDPVEPGTEPDPSPVSQLQRHRPDHPIFAFTLFDGTIRTSEPMCLHWHGAMLPDTVVFRPARWFNSYPEPWPRWKRVLWRRYRKRHFR